MFEARQQLDNMHAIICIVIAGHSASSVRRCMLQPKYVCLSIGDLYKLFPSDTLNM